MKTIHLIGCIIFAIVTVAILSNCNSKEETKQQSVEEKLLAPKEFSVSGSIEDYWIGNIHYKIFYRNSGSGMFVVNYTADSTEEAMHRQYFLPVDTTSVIRFDQYVKPNFKTDTMSSFKPILNHSKIPR